MMSLPSCGGLHGIGAGDGIGPGIGPGTGPGTGPGSGKGEGPTTGPGAGRTGEGPGPGGPTGTMGWIGPARLPPLFASRSPFRGRRPRALSIAIPNGTSLLNRPPVSSALDKRRVSRLTVSTLAEGEAMRGGPPVDPHTGSRLALAGRIVSMDDGFQVVDDGALYLDAGGIVAVQNRSAPPPAGFEKVHPVRTGGTIFPGLIELHNHLAYNVLQLWDVPKLYTNRNQWGGTPEYQRLISGPMKILGSAPGLMPAIVRFVECKCLAGGVTTSQG